MHLPSFNLPRARRRHLGCTLLAFSLSRAFAATAGNGTPTELDQITVTATRLEQDIFSVPYTAHVIHRENFLDRLAVRTLPDALAETPGVMVQKTSYGQGSPFLRGFTGFRTLLLVDGIRLNNAVFRDGPNQYWSTIDPLTIDRLDIVMGPASVLHGSDAIGGTLNAITVSPFVEPAEFTTTAVPRGSVLNGDLRYRYATAENSHSGRLGVSGFVTPGFGITVGASWKDYDDLRGGADTGIQTASGYAERSYDVKLHARLSPKLSLVAAYQHFQQDDVPRTHATTAGLSFAGTARGSDLVRNLDQQRELAYLQLAIDAPAPWLSHARVSLSRHRQVEEQDRLRSNRRREIAGFRDDQYGLLLHLESASPFGVWSYGAEYYYDRVDSHGADINAAGDVRILPRGNVADDASHRLLGLYIQNQFRVGDRTFATAGLRFSRAEATAAIVDPDPTDADTFAPLDRTASATTGSLRLRHDLAPAWNLFAGISQGFRAPNLSDYTSFEIARSGERETPAPHLQPETFTGFELGTKARIPFLATELYTSLFHTRIEDQVTRFPTGRLIRGDREVIKANAGDGYVRGLEFGARATLPRGFSVFGHLTWLEGRTRFPTDTARLEEPASRMQPFTVFAGLRWNARLHRAWLEASTRIAARQDDLSSGDVADTQRIPPGGTPGYEIYTLRGGWRLSEALAVTLALENIFDADYRIHGSGINEPGRNAVLSVHLAR